MKRMQKKTNRLFFLLIVCIVFFAGTIGLIYNVYRASKQSEQNTVLYTATVNTIQITDLGKEVYVKVYLVEYSNALIVATDVTKNIDLTKIENLNSGTKIYFRIESAKQDFINHVEFIDIVSLSTEQEVIFSLEDYNRYMEEGARPVKLAGTAVAFLFLLASLFIGKNMIKKKRQ